MVHKEPAKITCRDTVMVVTCSTPSHAAREKAGTVPSYTTKPPSSYHT